MFFIQRAATAIGGILIYAALARKYGAQEIGEYSYAISVTQIVAPMLVGGIEPVLVRDLIRFPDRSRELMGSAFLLLALLTLFSIALPLCYVALTSRQGEERVMYAVAGASLAFVPSVLLVLVHFFRSQDQMVLVVRYSLIGTFCSLVARLVAIYTTQPLYVVTGLAVLEAGVTGTLFVLAYHRKWGPLRDWTASWETIKKMFRSSWPALAASLVVVLFFRITHLMMKEVTGFEQLGYYAIAFQVFMVLNFFPQATFSAIYPKLVSLHATDIGRFRGALSVLLVAFSLFGYAVVIALFFLGQPVLSLGFGRTGALAAMPATILTLAAVFAASGAVRSQLIYIENKPILHIYNALMGLAVLVPLNLLLIPRFGATGAAASVTVSCFVSGVLSSFVFKDVRSFGREQIMGLLLLRVRTRRGDIFGR